MKGIKLYALLGSLSLMAACAPQVTLAADAAKKPASSGEQKFNEAEAAKGPVRGVRLDELFAIYAAPKADTTKMNKALGIDTVKPANQNHAATAHLTSKNGKHVAHETEKQPTVAKTPGVKPTGKSEVAIYKHAPKESDAIVAVSHQVISNSSTPVITASLDRPGTVPKYKSGDHMVINLKAVQECNVLVFDYDNKGTITQLWPNDFEPNGKMTPGQTVQIGGEDSKYTLDIDGKGLEQIFIYAYPAGESMDKLTVAMAPVEHTPFRAAKMTPAQYHRLIAQSAEYFPATTEDHDRGVSVKAKSGVSNAAFSESPANKLELVFQIEK